MQHVKDEVLSPDKQMQHVKNEALSPDKQTTRKKHKRERKNTSELEDEFATTFVVFVIFILISYVTVLQFRSDSSTGSWFT
jgi:hypothetical protein